MSLDMTAITLPALGWALGPVVRSSAPLAGFRRRSMSWFSAFAGRSQALDLLMTGTRGAVLSHSRAFPQGGLMGSHDGQRSLQGQIPRR